jgi:hypothetical protein
VTCCPVLAGFGVVPVIVTVGFEMADTVNVRWAECVAPPPDASMDTVYVPG